MTAPLSRYRLIDAFRGLAILWIMCFHVLIDVRTQYGPIINFIIRHGYLGVQVFFVISGYGFAASFFDGKYQTPAAYLAGRLKRIYVPFWWQLLFAALIIPYLGTCVALAAKIPSDMVFPGYTLPEWFQVISLARVFSAGEWALYEPFWPMNSALWYIAVIVQIYLFLALCMAARKYTSALMAGMGLLSLATFHPAVKALVPIGLFLPYFAQFYIGILTYRVLARHPVPQLKYTLGLVLLSAAAVFWCEYVGTLLLELAFSLLIASLFIALRKYDDKVSTLFPIRLLIFVGTFSYSLYLLHVPLWFFVRMFVRMLVPLPPVISDPLFIVPGIMALSFLWYLFFEKASPKGGAITRLLRPMPVIRSGMGDVKGVLSRKSGKTQAAEARPC